MTKLISEDKILIIDPNEDDRRLLADLFRKYGFQVLTATDGVEALSLLNKKGKVDVILTDLHLPRLDAWELLEKRQDQPLLKNVPVVIYATFTNDEEKEEVLEAGASDFIPRGVVKPAEIVRRVAKVMGITRFKHYDLQVDPYALDAQRFIEDYHLGTNFKCVNCGTPLAVRLLIQDTATARAQIVCPNCQQQYL